MIKVIKEDWKIIAIGILSIVLISLTLHVVNKEKQEIAGAEPVKVYVGLGKDGQDVKELDNFSKKEAVEALRVLFVEAMKDTKGRTFEERMTRLENNYDIDDVLSKETLDKIYMSEEFSKDKFNRLFTASTVLIQARLATENSNNEDIYPAVSSYEDAVYLDSRVMNAFVPLDIFVGSSTGYAFEMQYIDGEWKLNPYSLIMSMKLSELLINKDN